MNKAITIGLFSLASSTTLAQCLSDDIETQYEAADVIFVGKPVDVFYTCNLYINFSNETREDNYDSQSRPPPKITNCHGGDSVARFQVTEIYKNTWDWLGADAKTKGVTLFSEGSVHGLLVTTDYKYLVFGKRLSVNTYIVQDCSGSTVLEFDNYQTTKLDELKRYLDKVDAP